MTLDASTAPSLIPLDDALHFIESAVTPLTQQESVALAQGLDRIVSTDTPALINVPPHNNSAMDGYALRSGDIDAAQPLRCIGHSQAGAAFKGQLAAGECVRIMTGAKLPEGADAVVMQENTQRDQHLVSINETGISPGNNVRFAGEDMARGDIIVPRGRRLSPADIGVLAATGYSEIPVYKQVRVALFATGNELKQPGDTLSDGAIYESNRALLTAMLSRLNFEVLDLGVVADSPEKISEAFSHAAQNCDAIISTGGASVGDSDYTREVFESFGEVSLYKLAIKPGKPFCFGKKDQAFFFGLPGNPVSAAVTFQQLVIPALRKLSGEGFIRPPSFIATAKHAIRKRPGRADFQRGIFEVCQNAPNGIFATALAAQGSGVLSSLCKANCLIKLESPRGDIKAGEPVEIIPFDRWIA